MDNEGAGLKKIRAKLDYWLRNGQYYQAHQMYRTVYFRYIRQKRYLELLKLLHHGCERLLCERQWASGTDLGILYIDVLKHGNIKPNVYYFKIISNLFRMMEPSTAERETYVQKCLQWSSTGNNYKNGHPYFHRELARIYWDQKNFSLAKQHFMQTKDGESLALMLIELQIEHGYSYELDIFVAQIVLQCLCLQNKVAAIEVFSTYVNEHPQIQNGPPFILPLLNFIYFLLKSIETKKLSVFTFLCEQYKSCLSRDQSFSEYLEKIGQIYFGMKTANPNRRGLLGSFIQSIFNGLEEDDLDDK
ncbi:Golgi to ER traffic protein 4 homolog [Trichogramma pretiosum]|uniref:Golgi to ER traffic protein 4 homolog n=1 Tax=Trichogramma pretiosum TaxID=7493 RepID=UPI0006C9CBF4|nr:Golgi to ER traffic protein 4 homolog [Trichogramma pretiosum]